MISSADIQEKLKLLKSQHEQLVANLNATVGAIRVLESLLIESPPDTDDIDNSGT